MAQQTRWEKTNKDKKNLLKYAKPGMTFYGVQEQSALGRRAMAPQYMCDRWTITHMHPIFRSAMVGSSSLESILFSHGPLYATPITSHKGKPLHPMWEPLPQVAGPLGNEEAFGRPLDTVEIQGLRKRVRDNTDAHKKAKRGRWI
ncbi:hypothetical protein [Streptomyces sp. ME19-01-6]|uniref:hypothetical protein n=1 Tax=Streptomyces sp. ME19-01-6 TaxID=3028686 RepID=UPI0029BF510D|nr:hypothetical protein [Streptomyces sp. ME19-01-6]MDX3230596.1 hypothetical protein [Streptomyces sp. ME19-01-6]